MQYAVLIYEKPGAYDPLSSEERQALTDEYMAIHEEPCVIEGARLQPVEMTTTVRSRCSEMGYVFPGANPSAFLRVPEVVDVVRHLLGTGEIVKLGPEILVRSNLIPITEAPARAVRFAA